MSRPVWTDEEQRLADVLDRASREAAPRPDGWAAVAARVAGDDLAARRERRRQRARGIVAAVAACGLVAAMVVFVVGGGLRRDPTPSAPTQPPTSTAGFDPSSPRTTWTIYRAGSDKLYADEVRAAAPYDPAQAFTALFSQRPVSPGPKGLEASGGNVVASLRQTPTALVLDLDAADTLPRGRSSQTAELEAQGWVATAHAAFNGSELPLVVTVHGQPFSLFGVIDTATPIKPRDVPTVTTQRIFLPEAGGRVTSPVAVVGNPGQGDYVWTIRDEATGREVWSEGAYQERADGTIGFSPDLPPGSYELVVEPGPDHPAGAPKNLFQSDFTVSGPAPVSTHTPITNPPTTEVPRVALTWPRSTGTGLVEEWRPKGSAEQVIADLAAGPSRPTQPVVRPWQGVVPSSVTTAADRVVVDLTSAPALRAPDPTTAHRWALTLVRAVQDVLQTDLPVQVTVGGRPTELFAQLDTSNPLGRAGVVAVRSRVDAFTPTEGHWGTGEAVVVGAAEADSTDVTWYVVDPVSNETLYQGRAALDAEKTYGFRLPLPAGAYLLTIHLDGGVRGNASAVYDLTVL